MLDCVIIGGSVIDGTGRARRPADIAVRDGRIVTVGRVEESSRRRIQAAGLVVSPGFVDIHTHYDAQLLWDPTASPSAQHGVTTVIGGNCGFSLAPAGPENASYLMRMMARVEGIPLPALETALSWDWTSFDDWLARLEGRIAVNAGFLAGHSALRRFVLSDASTRRAADDQEVRQMAALLEACLQAGALGLSSSRTHVHNDGDGQPVPSRSATTTELSSLASVLTRHPGTTLELILSGCIDGFSEEDTELMAALSHTANRPLNWNLLGVRLDPAKPDEWRHQLAASDWAEAHGGRVVALTLPHLSQVRLSFHTGFVFDGLPGWRETMFLPIPDRLRALSDRTVRQRLSEGASSQMAGLLGWMTNWDRLEITETFAIENEGLAGRTVGQIAAGRGCEAFDALLDIVVADGLRTGLQPPIGDADDDDAWRVRAEVWKDPRTVVGGSDAGAHVDLTCGALYTTHLLGDGVRDRRLLTLEEAVHQLTDVPARLYGLRGRGRIQPGYRADLVIFDPDRVGAGRVRTRFDLPAGSARLYAGAEGIDRVLVNGVEIVVSGESTGALPGTLLRSGRDTQTVPAAGPQVRLPIGPPPDPAR
jgi:N-acyl-D-aspartate/D-glutamate deacylase